MGSFQLEGTGDLPNVQLAFPGEHWSHAVASGGVTPGEAVVPVASGTGPMHLKTAESGDSKDRLAIALQTVQPPDPNVGPAALGPNEVMNKDIANGEYVHAYYSGAFNLTLVDPNRTYEVGMTIGWDADGARPEGKDGEGSWAPDANADIDSVFEVINVRQYGSEYLLTVRFVGRTQM